VLTLASDLGLMDTGLKSAQYASIFRIDNPQKRYDEAGLNAPPDRQETITQRRGAAAQAWNASVSA
jgi:hypothetical protein